MRKKVKRIYLSVFSWGASWDAVSTLSNTEWERQCIANRITQAAQNAGTHYKEARDKDAEVWARI